MGVNIPMTCLRSFISALEIFLIRVFSDLKLSSFVKSQDPLGSLPVRNQRCASECQHTLHNFLSFPREQPFNQLSQLEFTSAWQIPDPRHTEATIVNCKVLAFGLIKDDLCRTDHWVSYWTASQWDFFFFLHFLNWLNAHIWLFKVQPMRTIWNFEQGPRCLSQGHCFRAQTIKPKLMAKMKEHYSKPKI